MSMTLTDKELIVVLRAELERHCTSINNVRHVLEEARRFSPYTPDPKHDITIPVWVVQRALDK